MFRRFRFTQFLSIALASVMLLFFTACSSVNAQGARPYNPPVQMGGNNNPYKGSGDSYSNLRMAPEGVPAGSQGDRKFSSSGSEGLSPADTPGLPSGLPSSEERTRGSQARSNPFGRDRANGQSSRLNQGAQSQSNADTEQTLDRLSSASSKLLYPGLGRNNMAVYRADPEQDQMTREAAQRIPEPRQLVVNRNDSDTKILERAAQTFDAASAFLRERPAQ